MDEATNYRKLIVRLLVIVRLHYNRFTGAISEIFNHSGLVSRLSCRAQETRLRGLQPRTSIESLDS